MTKMLPLLAMLGALVCFGGAGCAAVTDELDDAAGEEADEGEEEVGVDRAELGRRPPPCIRFGTVPKRERQGPHLEFAVRNRCSRPYTVRVDLDGRFDTRCVRLVPDQSHVFRVDSHGRVDGLKLCDRGRRW